ncbi:MAG: HPF/RaiA family ribosome-associated protein [Candidatus Pacebacteria bacterium]|nr:HPF/RaiA family ribosome-associated protein [Candidatus Paceibacterota bacterium]
MEIQFKVSRTKNGEQEVSAKALDLAERKIRNLKKYFGDPRRELGVQVYVELGKDSEAHHTGPFWRAQIHLDDKGERFNAEATADRIEVAVVAAVSELERELRSRKVQRESMLKRGGTALKSLLRGFGSR